MSRGNLNLCLSYFFFLSLVAGMPLVGVFMKIFEVVGIREEIALPSSITLALTTIAVALAAKWKLRGFLPKAIDPKRQRSYQTGQIVVATGNIVVLVAIVFPYLLNINPVITGPLLMVGLLVAAICWLIGHTKIKNSAFNPPPHSTT